MAKERTVKCGWCGEEFATMNNRRKYCCDECKNAAGHMKSRERERKKKPKLKKAKVTIEDIVEIANRMSKEQGRIVHYGEVQAMIYTGRLKV